MDDAARRDTVRRIARDGDPDRSLAALFAPRCARDDLFALIAFNVELARVAEQVSEPDLGAIRLQWWREAIERAKGGEATGHPVADAFGETLRRRALAQERVAGLIDARSFDVAERVMPDETILDAYLHDTAAALFALAAEIMGAKEGGLEQAAEEAGRAYGLTGLMRAIPVHAAKGRLYVPEDLLRRRGTSPGQVLAGTGGEGLDRVVADLRRKARSALDKAAVLTAPLDAPIHAAFLPLSLVEPYLAALEKKGRDPLRHIAGINPLYRLWRMATWR